MKVNIVLSVFFFIFGITFSAAQNNMLSYAGNDGNEVFYDVIQMADQTILIVGGADNLDWIDGAVPRTELSVNGTIPNGLGTNRFGFILHLNSDLQSILEVVHFPQGAVEDIRFIKTNGLNYSWSDGLYISCNTSDTDNNNGGYVICKLNNNFYNGVPDSFDWIRPVWAKSGPKDYHPWDVTNDGRVFYVSGEAHSYDWSAMYCLNNQGERMIVENWRTHWLQNGSEFHGTPASSNPDESANPVAYSGIVMKATGRCELRSLTQEDYDAIIPDGNGGTKKGKWPLDILFSGPCDMDNPSTSGPGYTGYQLESCCPVYGASCIAIDKTNNHVYLGMNMKSYNVDVVTPDFEPAVIAMDDTGEMLWWSRLYHEITPAGDTMPSIPDQYVDALAIDYFHQEIVVGARAHGNNTENFWEGNTVNANPSAHGFQNQFTGTQGNNHISWIGKLDLANGELHHSTYLAELAEGTGSLGTQHADPNLLGWPDPNTGWPDVNTTRLSVNNMKVNSHGEVVVIAEGRRTCTTVNAYQHNISPYESGQGAWNSFVRVYNASLEYPKYSSLVVGQWDPATQIGGGNIKLHGVWKLADGVVCVGKQTATNGVPDGNNIPVINVPSWGSNTPAGESAVVAYYRADSLFNADDQANLIQHYSKPNEKAVVYPNPADDEIRVLAMQSGSLGGRFYEIINISGMMVMNGKFTDGSSVDISALPSGVYFIRVQHGEKVLHTPFVVSKHE